MSNYSTSDQNIISDRHHANNLKYFDPVHNNSKIVKKYLTLRKQRSLHDKVSAGVSQSSARLVVCGGGPCGTGFLIAALRDGSLEELCADGLVVLESSDAIGPGSLCSYQNGSNSIADAFAEIAESLKELEPALLEDPSYKMLLQHRGQDLAALTDLLPYMVMLGKIITKRIIAAGGRVLTGTTVTAIDSSKSSSWYVVRSTQSLASGLEEGGQTAVLQHEITADQVIIAIGGKSLVPSNVSPPQPLPPPGDAEFERGATFSSDDYLRSAIPPTSGHTVIVGCGASAWSAAGKVMCNPDASATVTIVSRGSPRLFFFTAADADAAGYSYDPVSNVCPLTKRVNRYGGLRGASHTLAISALAGEIPRIKFVDAGSQEADASIKRADRVVVCCGYGSKADGLMRCDGKTVELSHNKNGQLSVDSTLRVLDSNGKPIEGLFCCSIGSAVPHDLELGGEPGWAGPIDGVWLYNFDMGKKMLRSLSNRGGRWLQIYDRIANTAAPDAPLHVVGGYQMFTKEQWVEQTLKLLEPLQAALSLPGCRVLEVGIGAGAFAEVILRSFPNISSFHGVDYSAPAVEIANFRLREEFGQSKFTGMAGNAADLKVLMATEEKFDVVVSFGLTQYLDSISTVEDCLVQMVSVLKPTGHLYVGEVSDEAKREEALAKRSSTHKQAGPDQMYIPQEIFYRVPETNNISIVQHEKIGLTYPTASYRYSAYLTKR
jgi:ubiquinone/menaquinone biosynthesis C-methylase UbiE